MSKSESPPIQAPESLKSDIRDLAKKHGMIVTGAHDGDPYRLAHMMAALLHGWPSEQYHQGLVEMTEDDYLKALAAAETGETHAPANRRPV